MSLLLAKITDVLMHTLVIALVFSIALPSLINAAQEERHQMPPATEQSFERNHLARELSPYLLQHADNPVDWYPWGEEAFNLALDLDKPIFLSIGYSTCHWCHVMEHESFEDSTVAALMNETFVCIKVDREERPDIDHLYMSIAQMMIGSGGWPLTIIMTPDKIPFYAATYIPKETRFGRAGMLEIIPMLANLWQSDRARVAQTTGEVMRILNQPTAAKTSIITSDVLEKAVNFAASKYDTDYGGFSERPKFPSPHVLIYLLRYGRANNHNKAMDMALSTLEHMQRGGIYDHIGFGFHRYSTDREWLVPHFEKMLYDQAMLVLAYTEAFEATGEAHYKATAKEIITYVMRDMTANSGGFYTAEDADSDGEEGKFYVWNWSDLTNLLNGKQLLFVQDHFGVQASGNFIDEAAGTTPGTNIFHLQAPLTDEDRVSWHAIRTILFESRSQRPHPYKDDKILTDWNGLMIAALARAGVAFREPTYIAHAEKAAGLIKNKLVDSNGRLLHRMRGKAAGIAGQIDDYAFLIAGLLDLYEATFNLDYLEWSLELNQVLLDHFWDSNAGGFFTAADDGESLPVRSKASYDGAIPAGNSVAASNLMRISRITGQTELEQLVDKLLNAQARPLATYPLGYAQLLNTISFGHGPALEIVIVGDQDDPLVREMLDTVRGEYYPNKVILLKTTANAKRLGAISAYTTNQMSMNGQATAYICRNFVCDMPTNSTAQMLESMRKKVKPN